MSFAVAIAHASRRCRSSRAPTIAADGASVRREAAGSRLLTSAAVSVSSGNYHSGDERKAEDAGHVVFSIEQLVTIPDQHFMRVVDRVTDDPKEPATVTALAQHVATTDGLESPEVRSAIEDVLLGSQSYLSASGCHTAKLCGHEERADRIAELRQFAETCIAARDREHVSWGHELPEVRLEEAQGQIRYL